MKQIMDNIDERRIWSPTDDSRSQEEWAAIIDHLARTLGDYLHHNQESVVVERERIMTEGLSLFCPVQSNCSTRGPLDVTWLGTIGMQPRLPHGDQYISATLFIFCQEKRMSVIGHKHGSYVDVIYEQTAQGGGRWRCLGWRQDEIGEYKDIE